MSILTDIKKWFFCVYTREDLERAGKVRKVRGYTGRYRQAAYGNETGCKKRP